MAGKENLMSKPKIEVPRAHCKNEKCGTSWPSITQLRKARRKRGSIGAKCPECSAPLTRSQAAG